MNKTISRVGRIMDLKGDLQEMSFLQKDEEGTPGPSPFQE